METKRNDFLGEVMHINILSTGIKCYIIPKKGYKEKQAMISVNYGSVDNNFSYNDEKCEMPEGIAHFLEHKLFEEEGGNIFDEFSKLGSTVNAFTNFTTTAYYFNCVDNFKENLKLLFGFATRPFFTDENVEKEKGIIEQEINMYEDDPFFKVYFNMMRGLYAEHPVRNNIAGSVSSIKKIDKEMLYKCYHTFYYPSNMNIVCVGDFVPEVVYEIAHMYIKPAEERKITRNYGQDSKSIYKQYIEEKMAVARPIFHVGFKDTDGEGDINIKNASTKILLDMLAGQSSNLYEKLYREGLVDDSFSYDFISGRSFGSSMFSGFSNEPKKVLEYINEEIKNVKQKGLDKDHFERIRKKQIGRFMRGFNSIDAIASSQIDLCSRGSDLFNSFESYQNVKFENIKDRLEEHFNAENAVLSVVAPQ